MTVTKKFTRGVFATCYHCVRCYLPANNFLDLESDSSMLKLFKTLMAYSAKAIFFKGVTHFKIIATIYAIYLFEKLSIFVDISCFDILELIVLWKKPSA